MKSVSAAAFLSRKWPRLDRQHRCAQIRKAKKDTSRRCGTMSKYDVRYLMHGGKSEEVEGKAHNRIVVIEFLTHEAALTFPLLLSCLCDLRDDGIGGGFRISGFDDGATDHQIIGAGVDRLRRRHDALLIAGRAPGGAGRSEEN